MNFVHFVAVFRKTTTSNGHIRSLRRTGAHNSEFVNPLSSTHGTSGRIIHFNNHTHLKNFFYDETFLCTEIVLLFSYLPISSSLVGFAVAVIKITARMASEKHTVLETIVNESKTFFKPSKQRR